MAYRARVLQMVYRHLEAEANGRARMAEEALFNASVRAHGTTSALQHPQQVVLSSA